MISSNLNYDNLKKKISLLILAHDQFGYSTTKFKHCEYAANEFDVTYVGWDYDLPRVTLPNVKVIYVSRKSNLFARNFQLLKTFHEEINKDFDVVIANYVRGFSILPILNPNAVIMAYVDTLGVMPNKTKRWIYDTTLKFELFFFKNVALISDGVAKKLGLKKYHVLPLGGECFSTRPKTFEALKLLYVGSLDNRNIIDCVKGFHEFLNEEKLKGNTLVHDFTIVGDSPYHELNEIKKYIKNNNLETRINTTGFVPQSKLEQFFNKANIGVSYVPFYSYYQLQPPTKTYEYLVSGLPVLATSTHANQNIVESDDGILIDDNPSSFYRGLCYFWNNKLNFNSAAIKKKNAKFTWESVVKDKFIPLIIQLAESQKSKPF